MMKKNMGVFDKIVRIILALLAVILYATGTVEGTFGYIILGVAFVFLLTSFISFCPLYKPFGISTCRNPNSN